jgi:ABC-type glucose/galactose transport system permease subunit
LTYYLAGAGMEYLSGLSELYLLIAADQELLIQGFLQTLDHLAQCRLSQVQLLGGAGKVAGFHQGQKAV